MNLEVLEVEFYPRFRDEDIRALARLPRLAELWLGGPDSNDWPPRDFATLESRLPALRSLRKLGLTSSYLLVPLGWTEKLGVLMKGRCEILANEADDDYVFRLDEQVLSSEEEN